MKYVPKYEFSSRIYKKVNRRNIEDKDRRPIIVAKGLDHETAQKNQIILHNLGIVEVISLASKHNINPKAVKLVCKNYSTMKNHINKFIFVENKAYNIQPNVSILQCRKCMEFGHSQFRCTNNSRCEKCRDSEHLNDCKSLLKCMNC